MALPPQATPDPLPPSTDAAAGSVPAAAARGPAAPADEVGREMAALRQTIAALEASRDHYRDLYEAAPVGYLTLGRDGRIGSLNRAAARLLGADRETLLGQCFERLVQAPSLAAWQRQFMFCWQNGNKQLGEFKLQRPDGSGFVAQLDSVVAGDGPAAMLALTLTDISQRWLAEQDLNHAQSVAHIGSWRLDVRRNELSWSRENHRIFGLPEGTPMSYETFLGTVHPDDVATVDQAWHAALAGAPYDIEHRLLVGGEVKWVREKAELEFDPQGHLCSGFGITQDITEIMLARQAMQESQERFRAFMTHNPAASWIVDADGRFQYASPNYYKMFQLPCADLVGKTIAEVYPPELAAIYLRGNQAVIDGGRPVESVNPGLLASGGAGEFLVVKFPIRDARGQPLVCGIALDVTEQRQAAAALRQAHARLEVLSDEQAADLRELADNLANAEQRERDRLYELLHDDVQPMLVAVRLVLSSLNAATPPAEVMRVVQAACQQVSQVIEVARTLGRHLSPPLIREQGLKAALESHCQWVTENYGLPVDLFCALDGEPADASIRLFCFGAVRELLLNVVKHAAAERACVTLQMVEAGALRIAVADSGHGFDAGALTSGTGLAAIARRIGLLGGRLRVDSRPGHGTVARLFVPFGQLRGDAAGGENYSEKEGGHA